MLTEELFTTNEIANANWLNRPLYEAARTAPELLVLILVLAMGMLGSTIFITQIFYRQEHKDLGYVFYFSRPFGTLFLNSTIKTQLIYDY